MDDDDLNILSKDVFATVGPARIASVWLLYAQTRLGAGDTGEVQPRMLLSSAARLRAAHQMLSCQFPERIAAAGIDMPEATQARAGAVVQSLEKFGPIADRDKIEPAAICDCLRTMPDLETHCFDTTEPAINEFLDAVTGDLARAQAVRTQAHFEQATEAVSQVQRIGTSIRMVAINASVEAARAGDAGAGFGVIASETQALATQMAGLMGQISQSLTAEP